jgi:hypothetical protein
MLTIHDPSALNADEDNLAPGVSVLEQLVAAVSCVTPSGTSPDNA